MELFDKKFVYLEWDDCLKGKKVAVGDSLQLMRRIVNDNTAKVRCVEDNSSNSQLHPFIDEYGTDWALVYYDPNYECKVAYEQGKTIQYKNKGSSDPWKNCAEEPYWAEICEYRVKPEHALYLYVYTCSDDTLHISPHCTMPSFIFEGTEEECKKYIKEHYCDKCVHQSCTMGAGTQFCKGFKERECTCSSCQYQCTPDVDMPCVTCEEYGNYKPCIVMQGEWKEDMEMTGALYEVAVNNAEKKYGLKDSMCMNIQESAYVEGFEAGVKYVYDRLREEQLKEVERTMNKVLGALVSWKSEVEK